MQLSPKKGRKSKPSFEVPAETESQSTAVGWVFRDEAEPLAAVIPITSAAAVEKPAIQIAPSPAPAERPAVVERSYTHPLLIAGAGMFFVGVGTVGVATLLVLAATATPIHLAKRWFGN